MSCDKVGGGGPQADYFDNIACSGRFHFSNGQSITVDTQPGNVAKATTDGTECLIHADASDIGKDVINPTPVGAPITITGGSNNPNPALRNVTNISRSDSVATVPVYEVVGGGTTNLCPSGCTATGEVVGFLQLGILSVNPPGTPFGSISAVILNAAGANPANSGTPPIRGGEVSPVPVRLIQ